MKLQLNTYLGSESDRDSRGEVIAEVFEAYRHVVGENAESLDESLKDLEKEDSEKIVNTVLSHFNVEKEGGTEFDTLKDLVDYVVEHKGETTGNVLKKSSLFLISSESIMKLKAIEGLATVGYSQEGLMSFLSDAMLGMVNTLKVNLTRFGKAMKQSEMVMFENHNHFLCKDVENAPVTQFMNVNVDIPTGMLVTYMDATEFLSAAYQHIECVPYLESLKIGVTNLLHDLSNSNAPVFPKTLSDVVPEKEKAVSWVGTTQTKIYKDNAVTEKKPFKKVYPSMKDFGDTRLRLTDMESRLQDVDKITGLVDSISNLTSQICKVLEGSENQDKSFIKDLAATTRLAGQITDIYGITAMRQLAVEHNHVLNYQNLYKLL